MKNILLVVSLMMLILTSCTKQSAKSSTPNPPTSDTSSNNMGKPDSLYLKGTLIPNNLEPANGIVKIFKTNVGYRLDLDSFIATPGPDLHVYLSQEATPIHIIDLGNLKATSGYQSYVINGSPNFSKFTYATIHCQQFNVVFGYTYLK